MNRRTPERIVEDEIRWGQQTDLSLFRYELDLKCTMADLYIDRMRSQRLGLVSLGLVSGIALTRVLPWVLS